MAAYLGVGILLGFGLAAYRLLPPGQQAVGQDARAQEKGSKQGVFSPPGTSDSGTVVPPPGEPPFKGKIGRTVGESTSDWPPIEGVSFAKTFDNSMAQLPREAQYFEMFAQRAIYLDGWRAYAPWPFGTQITAKDLVNDHWMLFHIDTDFSEATDVAAKYPEKLAELQQLWWAQASKYKVLPLDGSGVERFAQPRPQMSSPRDKYLYFPGTGEVETNNAVDIRNRSYRITADVEIPKEGAQGVLLAHGGNIGGYSFFINKDGKLQFSLNYVGLEELKVIAAGKVPTGQVTLGWEFQKTGAPDLKVGKGAPGVGKLFVNGKQVGEGKFPVTIPLAYSLSGDGLCCGRDTLTPVSADYTGEFPFTGVIRRVTVDVSSAQHPTATSTSRD